jgi:TonB-linked SusC/RagA family outer membrane protein
MNRKEFKTIFEGLRKSLVFASLVCFGTALMAQSTITGTVADATGALPGVSVIVKGTATGTLSGNDGKYSINVPDNNATLVFSLMGFGVQEIAVNGKTLINVTMKEALQEIDEVVVVGFGSQKKVNMTGSVSSIKVDDKLTSRSLTNTSTALSGLAAGLTVSQSTGMAGSDGASLLIRGLGTVNNASPLIVVDGMPDVSINRLNMSDIETISILKDAASSAVYGSRAANGVILITTKSGKNQEKTHLDFTGSYAVAHPVKAMQYMADYPRAMTASQRMQMVGMFPENTAYKDGTVDQWLALSMIDPLRYPNTDWWDIIIRNGAIQNYTLSATGGGEKANFYASIGLMDNKGLQIENDFSRYNARFNFDYRVKKNINIGLRFDGNWSKHKVPYSDVGFSSTDGSNEIKYAIAGMTPYDPETGYYGGVMAYGEDVQAMNPYAYYMQMQSDRNRQDANVSLFGDWEIIKGLSARVDYALSYYNEFVWKADMPVSGYNFQTGIFNRIWVADNSPISNTTYTGYKTMLNGRLNYSKVFAKHHEVNLMAAYSEEFWYNRGLSAWRSDRLHPSLHEIDAALTSQQGNWGSSDREGLKSWIARLNYSAYGKYLLEISFRSDGSSKFAEGHQWGFFPSASVGWRFTEEDFIRSFLPSWISSGKFRAAYGSLGNNSGVGKYEQNYVMTTSNYMINGSIVKGFINKKLVNLDLTWETTTVTNIGLELGFLKGRLNAELDYYNRLTSDMNRPSDISLLLSGTYTAPRTNIGKMRNRGVEATINWRDRIQNLNYSLGANLAYNRSALLEWNEHLNRGWVFLDMPYQFVYSGEDSGIAQTWQDIYLNGTNTGSAPGDMLMLDLNGDGNLTSEDMKAYPNYQRNQPTFNFSFNGYVEWKGIDMSFLFQGAAGRKSFWLNSLNDVNPSAGRYAFSWEHLNNTWSWENRNADLPRMGGNGNRNESSFWLDNMAYLRLKNLQLGYNLPRKWLQKIRLDHLRIYCSAENLLTLTSYRGLDPEIVDPNAVYPLVKTFSLGINIGL